MKDLLEDIYKQCLPLTTKGKVADYIPALAKVNPNQFGIAIYTNEGKVYSAGDAKTPFSIQSISKVFGLTLAMQRKGDDIWQRVGREPSGLPFNSLVQLEYENGIPRNPFINAGALVISDMIESHYAASNLVMKHFVRRLARNEAIKVDEVVAASEYEHRSRNAAMAYLMKAFGNFDNDVEKVLLSYFSNCAITMSCIDLAKSVSYLANNGVHLGTDRQVLTKNQTKQLNALMATSGLYDEAGRFAFKVGMPGKSGVGGGIIAIVPGKLSICVWSPSLNEAGNSYAGLAALEMLSEYLGWSVY
ncbi:glutaminase B [Thalassotalea euphylliae]|uniref:glutaminase B n=1 Tax=Thalassotalea euphylliae TaxID=1655234 RepID=UPI00362CC9D8